LLASNDQILPYLRYAITQGQAISFGQFAETSGYDISITVETIELDKYAW
jgi:hypothetical protein